MKKKLCMMAIVLALATGCVLPVSAATLPPETTVSTVAEIQREITYFEDGSYIVTTIEEVTPASRAITNKTFRKTSTSYDSSNKAQCALTLIASFEVNMGVNVKCIGAKTEKNVYQTGWSVENVSTRPDNSSTSKASAIASGNFVKREAGIAVKTAPVTVKVTCDKNGNAS